VLYLSENKGRKRKDKRQKKSGIADAENVNAPRIPSQGRTEEAPFIRDRTAHFNGKKKTLIARFGTATAPCGC
jgi:hypothetical protein